MKLAADMGRHSGRATPSLHDTPYRQIEEATGRRSTYPLPIPVQTNPATSALARDVLHGFADGSVIRRAFAPDRLWVDTNQHTGPALGNLVNSQHLEHCVSPLA